MERSTAASTYQLIHTPAASSSSAFGVLHADQRELIVRCHHYLVLLRTNTQESQVVRGVEVANNRPCLRCQLMDQSRVLHCCRIVESRADWNTVTVDNQRSHHTLVGLDTFQAFLHLALKQVKTWCQQV